MTNISGAKQTPMMQQFNKIKERYSDAILFYRMGDFYEMFGDDAVIAAKVLQIQLTSRNKNKENAIPMCGVPHHAFEQYLNKLTAAGHKVAICEQTEDPSQAQGIVKRDVVRVVTPGTVTASDLLDASTNNFICSLYYQLKQKKIGIAFCDLTTGEFDLDEIEIVPGIRNLIDLLLIYQPKEILLPRISGSDSKSQSEHEFQDQLLNVFQSLTQKPYIEYIDYFLYQNKSCNRNLCEHFKVSNLAGFGLDGVTSGISAAGALLAYLKETQKDALAHLNRIKRVQKHDKMFLDEATIRNLEIFQNAIGLAPTNATLFGLLNNTKTAMGGRKLRRWLSSPLIDINAIRHRLTIVDALIKQISIVKEIRDILNRIGDLERLISRITMPNANIFDLVKLRESIDVMRKLKIKFNELNGHEIQSVVSEFDDLSDIYELLISYILDAPKNKIKEGGFINHGINDQLDHFRDLMKNGKQLIANMEAQEKDKHKISSLKIGFNRVFGYYIEISNIYKDKIPEHYIRKQTLVNSERYITEELKELEESILTAEDESKALELELYQNLKQRLLNETSRIQNTASVLSEIDVFCCFADNALQLNYTQPEFYDHPNAQKVEIVDSRHPVIEQLDLEEPFIPNDVFLDAKNKFISIITGPNMGGKSTYMRQMALIAMMAQIGSFVPAKSAKLPVFDRIFTRVGAADNLTRGQSTFMVEMSEASAIINGATANSLIILDEIGRGTSTFDGISIAWAMIEHIHQTKSLTLFATHYHELILLEETLAGVSNSKVVVEEENENIIFLRKVVPGKADKSYGIQVARLAGLPKEVVSNANKVLKKLEAAEKKFRNIETNNEKPANGENAVQEHFQTSFMPPEEPWVAEIKKFDINRKTPFQAMEFLHKLKKKISGY